MKILKITLAAILLALTIIDATVVTAAENDRYASYVPTSQDEKLIQKYRDQVVALAGSLEKNFGSSGTIDRLRILIQKSTALRARANNARLYIVLVNIEAVAAKEISKRTTVTTTTTTASTTPPSTATTGKIDVAKVKEVIAGLQNNEAIVKNARSVFVGMGFTEREAVLLSISLDQTYGDAIKAKKDIFFCAPFTQEIRSATADEKQPYYVMANYTTASDIYPEGKKDVPFRYTKLIDGEAISMTEIRGGLNPWNDLSIAGRLGFVSGCTLRTSGYTQSDMVALFAKLGMTYTPQTKPFWEVDPDLITKNPKRTIGEWVATLYK